MSQDAKCKDSALFEFAAALAADGQVAGSSNPVLAQTQSTQEYASQSQQHTMEMLYEAIARTHKEMVARDANSIIRLMNSVLVNKANQPMTILRSIYTNTNISGFPGTLMGIMQLNDQQADFILDQLGASSLKGKDIHAKRQQIKIFAGLVTF